MLNILANPYDLTTTIPMLIELRFTLYLRGVTTIRRTFPTTAFAANIAVDDHKSLLASLDDACFRRIGEATRYTSYNRCSLTDYEVERFLVWNGLDDAKLSLGGLSDRDLQTQLELMERRGWQDRIRVHMAFEVEMEDGEEEKQSSDAESAVVNDGGSVGRFAVFLSLEDGC